MRQTLGQHFLVKGKTLERIAKAACGESVPLAVEIGPGRGALTERLIAHAGRVVAIELDATLAAHVRGRWPNLEIIEANALDVNWSQWGSGVLAGNLPYYIATPLISKYLHNPGLLSHAVFLIQKEVAERITAKPGGREFGYLSVECQLLAEVEYLFSVPPGAFQPPPKVDSAVIRLTPRPALAVSDPAGFLKFVSVCFRQKRKTLRNNLAAAYPREAFESRPEMSRRAEQLTIGEFSELYDYLKEALKTIQTFSTAESEIRRVSTSYLDSAIRSSKRE
ncbi:MAG TPA: 16S rRNA (adenine(1518)-N(6)/adenine(1519)-N(6))-dimethyltransferase RsmA [Bryobacteraceae bacterium]|nr:16S rRNA (adenine(1518)-N(6)/adenine(1519)-N(6))-dimethyltransferase RsmA [Bryobacteraceae bacterium]